MYSPLFMLPRILGNDYWDVHDYPTIISGQNFGHPLTFNGGRVQTPDMIPIDEFQRASEGFSNVHNDQNKFAVVLDCKQFKPDELNVSVDDDKYQLVIHGKHEERTDEHGYITREFERRYVL